MASIREYYINLNNKINEIKNLLADKLIQFNIIEENDRNLSFYNLLQYVNPEDFGYTGTPKSIIIPEEDPSIPHFNNTQELENFLYTNNTSKILTYEITLEELNYIIIKKTLYYRNYLRARLEEMGVSTRLINNARTIKELIKLLDYIPRIKNTYIEFTLDETLYYNIDRLLNAKVYDDTGEIIREGQIEVYIDDLFLIQYDITDNYYYKPQALGQHSIQLKYVGTKKFLSSTTSTYTFDVIDGFLKINAQLTNTNKKSPYYNKIIYDENNEPIYQGCKEDTWTLNVEITDGKNENISEEIPFSIRLMNDEITSDIYTTGIKIIKNLILPKTNDYFTVNNIIPQYLSLYIETSLNNENYIEASKIIKVQILYPPIYIDNTFLTQYKGDIHYVRTPVYLQDIYSGTPIEDTSWKSITITHEDDTFTNYYNTCMYYLEPFDELEYGITPFTITICKDTPSYMYQKINWENITQLSFNYRSAEYGILNIYIGEEKIGTVNPSENWQTFIYNNIQSLFNDEIYVQELKFENEFSDKYIFIDNIIVDKENAIVNNDFEMGLHAWTKTGDTQRSSQGQNGYCAIIKNPKECYTAKLEYNILSNFIIPKENTFYLPNIPQIYYKPRGEINTRATIDLTLNSNLTQVTSTATGLIAEISNLSNAGEYDIGLLTSSHLLEEEIILHYSIKEPLSIKRIGSEDLGDIIYQIDIYTDYHSCNINISNENFGNIAYSQKVKKTGTITTYTLTIPITRITLGNNTITIDLDDYITTEEFTVTSDLSYVTDMNILSNGNIQYNIIPRNDINNTELINDFNFNDGIITINKTMIEHYYDNLNDAILENIDFIKGKIIYQQYDNDSVNRFLVLDNLEFWTANNETININATMFENTTPIPNIPIQFITENQTITETTNSEGIATYTYVGCKAGSIYHMAKSEESMRKFIIYDSKFHNNKFYNHYDRIINNNQTLTNNSGQIGYYLIDELGTAKTLNQCYQYTPPFAILIKITEYTSGTYTFMYDGSHSFRVPLSTLSSKQNFTVLIKVNIDKVEYYVDGVLLPSLTWKGVVGNRLRGGLQVNDGATLTYQDVYLSDDTSTLPTILIISDKNILSYRDEDMATITATILDIYGQPYQDQSIIFTFKQSSTIVETQTVNTDSEGIATIYYQSKGVGDLTLTAQIGNIISNIYQIEDCIKYIPRLSKEFNTTDIEWFPVADLGKNLGNCEVTCKLKAPNKPFRIDFSTANKYQNESRFLIGVINNNAKALIRYGIQDDDLEQYFTQYTNDTDLNCIFHRENGNMILTIDDSTYTYPDIANLRYLGLVNYKNAKTVTLTDLKVKPLPQNAETITLESDKNILSTYHNDMAILTATVLDINNQPCEGVTVTFYSGSTIIGTSVTDNTGIATKIYYSEGAGDITLKASVGNLISIVYIEDCIFFDATETSKKTNYSAIYDKIYNDLNISSLPNNFVWEVDMKTSSNSGSENRLFLTSTNYNGDQPPYALWVQIAASGESRGGSRRNGSTYASSDSVTVSADTYVHFKVERNGSTVTYYVNDTNVGSLTEDWIDNYSNWWFSYTFWKRSNITGTWKNLKIKII